jgi:hypothetical protein
MERDQRTVYTTSTDANQRDFAIFSARVHMGTAARYTKAGMVRKHCGGRIVSSRLWFWSDGKVQTIVKNHFNRPSLCPGPVKTEMVIHAAMNMEKACTMWITVLTFCKAERTCFIALCVQEKEGGRVWSKWWEGWCTEEKQEGEFSSSRS